MLEYLKFQLDSDHKVAVIRTVEAVFTVEVELFDTVGMVARIKGRTGGFRERRVFPWSGVEWLSWER